LESRLTSLIPEICRVSGRHARRGTLSTSVGEAGLAQETWGAVEVLGVYHAAAGAPFLEMQSVRIAPQVLQPF